MNHGSLFSGIGGFDLAAEWMGWENVFHCEWNDFGRKVLEYYWPNAISYGDITKTDFTIHRGRIDILTGGFPCQPFSIEGKRKGTEDDRNLWPEMLRAIREIAPEWVVGENVFGITNWNGGLVFEQVQADLEAEGYQVQPYILPAAGVNAPHKRERVWFVAHSDLHGYKLREFGKDRSSKGESKSEGDQWERLWNDSRGIGEQGITPNSESERSRRLSIGKKAHNSINGISCENGSASNASGSGWIQNNIEQWTAKFKPISSGWERFPTQPPVCRRNDGISSKLDGITFPKWRSESIKAYGNAIVPQVAYQIFRVISKTSKN